MAVFQFDYGTTGLTVYAFLRPWGLATIWNGSAFVTYVEADWTDYDIAMPEDAGSGTYFGTWPAVPTGSYAITAYLQSGGTPDPADLLIGTSVPYGPVFFGGTSPPPPPGTMPTPAMEFQPPAPLASSLSSSPGRMMAGEVRLFTMDFDTQNELLSNGDAEIVSGSVTSDGVGLTVGTASFSRTELGAYLTAVTAGTYSLTYTVSLNDTGGTVIYRVGIVTVE